MVAEKIPTLQCTAPWPCTYTQAALTGLNGLYPKIRHEIERGRVARPWESWRREPGVGVIGFHHVILWKAQGFKNLQK